MNNAEPLLRVSELVDAGIAGSFLSFNLTHAINDVYKKLLEYFDEKLNTFELGVDLSSAPCTCGNWGYCGNCVQNVGYYSNEEYDKMWDEMRAGKLTAVLSVKTWLSVEEALAILDRFDNEFWLDYKSKMHARLAVDLSFEIHSRLPYLDSVRKRLVK
jgi:hypothetical protein